MDGEKFQRQMMAVSLLLTYPVKVLLGLSGMNCVGQTLFRDLALLKLIGYTTEQLQDGFCQRGQLDKQKPLHNPDWPGPGPARYPSSAAALARRPVCARVRRRVLRRL